MIEASRNCHLPLRYRGRRDGVDEMGRSGMAAVGGVEAVVKVTRTLSAL